MSGPLRALWSLDPAVAHLNHGSYGAVPVAVQREQQALQERAERNPVAWFRRDLPPLVVAARRRIAEFLGAPAEATALVTNATTGVSAVVGSVPLVAGDEVLLTDHGYGAVGYAVARACRLSGATMSVAAVPLGADDDTVVASLLARVGPRTRLAVIDQVTSPTAQLFPVARIAAALQAAGVAVLVDGAHAPGMLPLDVAALGADFWVGNLHKWCCAPRGTAALVVAPAWRPIVRTPVVSWGEPAGFPAGFDTVGTADLTGWLAAPAALDLLGGIGWDVLRQGNGALAAYGQHVLADALGVDCDALWGDPGVSMRVVPLPDGVATDQPAATALAERIATELAAEVAVVSWGGRGLLRISAQAYNTAEEYDRLATGLRGLLAR